ncbi:unnamed protein product [Moneuplotes crassus]|uniref:Uncharacterized protein n=1 Tax=Euplotes crassus TaxID=5936 RepID=A0AAD1Y1G0_EUPCR|nr:unnamed protein product [Moneuplotes crassus]
MKLAFILILGLILGSTFAKIGDPTINSGPLLVRYMSGDLQGTFIVMFYKKSAPSRRTSEIRAELNQKILQKYPFFHYVEADVDSGLYNDVIEDFLVDETELRHSPTVMIASEGTAYWVHGTGAVDDLKYNLPNYAVELKQ